MACQPRGNGGGAQATPPLSPRLYGLATLLQLIFLGLALITMHRDVGYVLPRLMRAGSSIMGVGFALTVWVDRGRYLFSKPPPSRLAWVWLALSVLCTIIGPLLPMR